MGLNLRFDVKAVDDLADIRDYLSERSPHGAERVRLHILAAINRPARFPVVGGPMDTASVGGLVLTRYPYEHCHPHIRHTARSPMTTNPEFDRWQERFSTPEYAFGKAPNAFLVRCRLLLPSTGKVLAVADGEGRNGVWLAKQGLDVLSLDFSPLAQAKARALAAENKVDVTFIEADVHAWPYPADAFDVVAEIFTQFSPPAERERKWAGMRRSLKSGGLLIVQGYTPKQLEYGTGGPKQIDQLYTPAMLEQAFGDFEDVVIVEEELELHEGASHFGMSAIIGLTARKP
jgi:SAM-dependent methyltransferase